VLWVGALSLPQAGGVYVTDSKMGMQAVIPIKKRVEGNKKKAFYEPFHDLVQWFDNRQVDFHHTYRLRPKVETFFWLVKRVATGYCWSRGRRRADANGKVTTNSVTPCTAWINETLCKMIYVNLRLTVQYELATGYQMNYLTDTFFPAIPITFYGVEHFTISRLFTISGENRRN
jgi:hypothetical protein